MPAIRLTAFSGEQPRILPRLLPETAAQSALNCRLDDGGLTPIRKPAQVAAVDGPNWISIHRHQGVWLGWDSLVHAVPGPVAEERLYYTGDGAPKMRIDDAIYDLALEFPAAGLTATPSGSGTGDVSARIYVYTYVTAFGEESEPSPVSNAIDWQSGQTVVLSGFALPADDARGIEKQRIYRSQTGLAGTYFYLIAERNISATDFTDNIAVDALQEPLPSASWNAPPADLSGLIALPNGMMAAFSGRNLCFCEPYRPHAWPERYRLTVDTEIVALGAMGTSLLILTSGQPYMANGTTPDTMQMLKVEQNLPCINARGVVDLGYAIAYPSHEGLVVARADGSFALVTANLFNRDNWLTYSPATMFGAQISGRYVGFYQTTLPDGTPDRGAIIIDLQATSFIIRANVIARAACYEVAEGGLFYLTDDGSAIFQFDAPNAARLAQYWKSKAFVLPYPENFGAIQIDIGGAASDQEGVDLEAAIEAVIAANQNLIDAGSILGDIASAPIGATVFAGDILDPLPTAPQSLAVGIYADGVRKATVTHFDRAVRLPGGFLARKWEIDVFGDVQVHQIVMAKTIDELRMTP